MLYSSKSLFVCVLMVKPKWILSISHVTAQKPLYHWIKKYVYSYMLFKMIIFLYLSSKD